MFILLENKINKKSRKDAESLFLDFIEGRISTYLFWEQYKNNTIYQEVLKKDKGRWKRKYCIGSTKMIHYGKGPFDKIFKFNPDTLLDICNINKLFDVYNLYIVISRYFLYRKIPFVCGNQEVKKYMLLQKMVPSYVDICDGEFLEKIYETTEQDVSQKERLKQAKLKIVELYRYDKNPPKWIQTSEWPCADGRPLVFSHQKNEIGRSLYYFYDPKTKEQVIIKQFD